MKHAAACNLEYLEGTSLRISELHNSTPKIQFNRFLANPTSLRVLLQGLRFSYDFNLKPSGMWECCGQPGSVYDCLCLWKLQLDMRTSLSEISKGHSPAWTSLTWKISDPGLHLGIFVRGVTIHESLGSLKVFKSWEVSTAPLSWDVRDPSRPIQPLWCWNPGDLLPFTVLSFNIFNQGFLMSLRKGHPRLQLHWKRAGRRSQKIHHPLWRTSVYPRFQTTRSWAIRDWMGGTLQSW